MKISFFPFFMSALILLSHQTNATDVCASELLNQELANKFCPKDCKDAGAESWSGVWLGKSDMDCSGKPSNSPNHNTKNGSICACTFKGCTDVNISYSYNKSNPANWTADAWYTPCGE